MAETKGYRQQSEASFQGAASDAQDWLREQQKGNKLFPRVDVRLHHLSVDPPPTSQWPEKIPCQQCQGSGYPPHAQQNLRCRDRT